MSNISSFTDFTGKMSQDEINGQNLSMIVEEMNRIETNQNAVNNVLTIIGQGKLTAVGTAGGASTTFASEAAYTFMAFFKTSANDNLFYPVPATLYDVNNNLTLSVQAYSSSSTINPVSGQSSITFSYFSTTSLTFTFYYFLIQQPASVTLA